MRVIRARAVRERWGDKAGERPHAFSRHLHGMGQAVDLRGISIGISLSLILQHLLLLGLLAAVRRYETGAGRAVRRGAASGGLGLALNALQGLVHPLLPYVLGNALVVAGSAWFWVGLRRLAGRDGREALVAVFASAMALVGLAFGVLGDHFGVRLAVFSLLSAALALLIAGTLWSWRGRPPAASALLGVALALSLVLTLRFALYAFAGIPAAGVLDPHPANAAVYLSVLLLFVAFVMLVSVLVAQDLVLRLAEAAGTDPLTGTLNRRALRELVECGGLAERRPRFLVLADLDDFKAVNDRLGHAAGDRVLVAFADLARVHLGAADHLVRLGGDEFLILTDATPGALCKRLREAFHTLLPEFGPLGVSLAWAELREPTPTAFRLALEHADAELFRVKQERARHPRPDAPGRAVQPP